MSSFAFDLALMLEQCFVIPLSSTCCPGLRARWEVFVCYAPLAFLSEKIRKRMYASCTPYAVAYHYPVPYLNTPFCLVASSSLTVVSRELSIMFSCKTHEQMGRAGAWCREKPAVWRTVWGPLNVFSLWLSSSQVKLGRMRQ